MAVEVFEGNTADPMPLAPQLHKLRQRFGLPQVVLVGDRGLLTEARLRDELQPVAGWAWITALRASAVQQLVHTGALQLSFEFIPIRSLTATESSAPGSQTPPAKPVA